MSPRLRTIMFAAAASLGLSACAYDGYGYGYGGLSYGGYYDDYYDGYGYPGYYGWWNDFYYPGTGFYVFDRSGGRHRWNDNQRRHWEGRREQWGNRNGGRDWNRDGRTNQQNWSGVNRDSRRGDWNGNRGDRGTWNRTQQQQAAPQVQQERRTWNGDGASRWQFQRQAPETRQGEGGRGWRRRN